MLFAIVLRMMFEKLAVTICAIGAISLCMGKPASAEAAPAHPDLHAGEAETSMLLSIAPDLVRTEIIPSLAPTGLLPKDVETWRRGYEHARKITPRGYLGDPANANAASGSIRIERQAAAFADAIAASVR